jgi:hypothetical protein
MALIPTFETLIFEIRKSFGLKDQKTAKGKSKFLLIDGDFLSHEDLYTCLKKDLFEYLKLSPNDSSAMDTQFLSMGQHLVNISQHVFTRSMSQPQVSWFIATHSIIPALARTAAYWQLDSIMDRGMPSGSFWYLPEEINGELKLPLAQVMDWLVHLIDKSDGLEQLIESIYGSDDYDGNSEKHGTEKSSIKRNLINWQTKPDASKTSKLIDKYFDDNTDIQYSNIFVVSEHESINDSISKAKKYLLDNKFNAESLKHEFNIGSTTELKAVLNFQGTEEENLNFIDAMCTRFSRPSNKTIIYRLKIALALQDMYIRFGHHIHGKEFSPTETCYEKNKILQAIFIFKSIYNLTYKIESETNPQFNPLLFEESDIAVDEALKQVYPTYLTMCIRKTGGKIVEERFSDFLNYAALRIDHDIIPSITTPKDNDQSSIALYESLTKEVEMFHIERNEICQGLKDVHTCEILYSLIHIIRDPQEDSAIRQEAITRVNKNTEYTPNNFLTFIFESELSFFIEMREMHNAYIIPGFEEFFLKKIRDTGGYDNNSALYLHIEGLLSLYKKDHKTSKQLFDQSIQASKETNSGIIRGRSARYSFMINAATKPNGYNLDSQKKYYRDMIMFGGMPQLLNMESPTEHANSWLLKANKGIDFELSPPIEEVEKILINEFDLNYISEGKVH